MKEYPQYETIGIISSGDPEKDSRDIEAFMLHEKRLIEGICPNGCGPMVDDGNGESHCSVCPFQLHEVTIHVG